MFQFAEPEILRTNTLAISTEVQHYVINNGCLRHSGTRSNRSTYLFNNSANLRAATVCVCQE
jgi:hypothetical protein